MTYKSDCDKHAADCKEAHRLYKVWQITKKDEDKDIWWKALTGIHSRKYLTITMTVWPVEGVDADKLKEMIESNGISLPWDGQNLYHGDQVVAEVIKARASTWPKPAM